MSKSSVAINNLRGYAILMVLAFHSFIAYLGSQTETPPRPFDSAAYEWAAKPIIDRDGWFGFDLFCAYQYLYLMQLMFFLSGLFVWSSLARKGARTFLYDRVLRLGVPFVFGVYLLMPVAYYPVYRLAAADPGWAAFWSRLNALPFWPTGPMWFLWFLLALNIAAAALFWLAPRTGEFLGRLSAAAGAHPGRFFIALTAASGLAYVPLAAMFAPWQWAQVGPFAFQPSFFLQYVIYFFAGLGVGVCGLERGLLAADGALARRWGVWLAASPTAFVLWIVPTALIVTRPGASFAGLQVIADLGLVLCAATTCLGLAAMFLRFSTVSMPVLASLAEHAYGIYLVHYVFVIWLQYLLLGVALHAVAKAAIVLAGTLILSWATTAAVCRLSIGARLIGGKRRELAKAP
jgi:peptidoglycan/LPS O-acetylase OafA/YrhL